MRKLKITQLIVILIVVFTGVNHAAELSPAVADTFVPARCVKADFSGPLMSRVGINYTERIAWLDPNWLLDPFIKKEKTEKYDGEFLGKWIDAAVRIYSYTGDENLRTKLDHTVSTLIATQEEDGYIGTYTKSARYTHWDVWTIKYTLIGLLVYANEFQDDKVLNACQRLGECFIKHVQQVSPEVFIASSFHGGMANTSILEPLCYLYEAGGDKKILNFCPDIFHQDVLKDINEGVFGTGKIYERQSNYLGLLEYGRLAKPDYVEGLTKAISDKIEAKTYYPVGAVSVGDRAIKGSMPVRKESSSFGWTFGLGKELEMVSPQERFYGRDGSEGCDTVTWMQLNFELFHLTGDIKFLEAAECVAYNQLSAHQKPSTGTFDFFLSPHGVRTFANRHTNYCCMHSLPRAFAMLPEMAVGSMKGSPAVALYLPGTYRVPVKGNKEIDLVIETNFPITGKGTIHVKCGKSEHFVLKLRVPNYTTGFIAKVEGKSYQGKPGEFLTISRKWSNDDKIEFDMKMEIALVPLYPAAKDNGRKVLQAVRRGPQFLAVDSTTPNKNKLYKGWIGTQKYKVPVDRDGEGLVMYLKDAFMVPYADAGQTGGYVEVFFPRIKWDDKKTPASLESIGIWNKR